MSKQITDHLTWINPCHNLGDRHLHVSTYLIRDGDQYILVDSGSQRHREEIIDVIDEETDGAGIDALLLTHTDLPHAGNIAAFENRFGTFELVCASSLPEILGLSNVTKCEIGDQMTIAGSMFSFHWPHLSDVQHTSWIYDHTSKTLFSADGFGHYHRPGECHQTTPAPDGGVRYEGIHDFHGETLVWLQYVNPDNLIAAIEDLLATHEVQTIAPIHGAPLTGDAIDDYTEKLNQAITELSQETLIW